MLSYNRNCMGSGNAINIV